MNRIQHLELNFPSGFLDDHGECRNISQWSQQDLLPIVDTILKQEWGKITRQWNQSSQNPIQDIRIHHLQLHIEAKTPESFKQELSRCLTEELQAAIRYSLYIHSDKRDRDKWSSCDSANSTESKSSDDGLVLTLKHVFQILFAQQQFSNYDNSALKSLERNWRQWLQQDAPTLRLELLRHLRHASHRNLVATRFPEWLQNQIITLLEPVHAEFILHFIAGISALQQLSPQLSPKQHSPNIQTPKLQSIKLQSIKQQSIKQQSIKLQSIKQQSIKQQPSPQNPKKRQSKQRQVSEQQRSATRSSRVNQTLDKLPVSLTRRYLVEFTLAYITCERGSRFNRKIYMRSVVRQLAQHDNMDIHTLSQNLREVIGAVALPLNLKSDLLDILQLDDRNDQSVDNHTEASREIVKIDYHRAIRTLKQCLNASALDSEREKLFIRSVDYLLRHDPDKMVQLLCDVDSVGKVANILATLPESHQLQLYRHLYHLLSIENRGQLLCLDIKSVLNQLKAKSESDLNQVQLGVPAFNENTQNSDIRRQELFSPFIRAIQRGVWHLDDGRWTSIKSGNLKYLRSLTRLLLQPLAVRQRVVENLPLLIQSELIGIIDPTASEMVNEVWQSGSSIHCMVKGFAKQDFLTPAYTATSQNINLALREFTFGYLVTERGGEFNQRSYGRSLLRQLSGRYNLNYQAFLVYLQGCLEQTEMPHSLKTQWQAILGLDIREPSIPESTATLADDQRERTWAQQAQSGQYGAACFTEIVELLSASSPPGLERWNFLIQVLALRHSLYFKRLVELIYDQTIPYENLYRNLSQSALTKLLSHFFTLNGYGQQSFAALKHAIEKYADRAQDSRAFYVMIIRELLQGKLIDLEKIIDCAQQWKPQPIPASGTAKAEIQVISVREKNHDSASAQDLAREKIGLMSQSLSNAQSAANEGEAVLLDYCYRIDRKKMQILYPVAQVLRLILSRCQLSLLEKEQEWASLLRIKNRLLEKQWIAVIFHGLAEQLVLAKSASVDWFIQQTVYRVFQLWQLDSRYFVMEGFLKFCMRQLYGGNYSWDKRFNRMVHQSLLSLTVADIGMEESEPVKHADNARLTAPETSDRPDSVIALETDIALEPAIDITEGVAVENAGLVILAPYIAILFERLNLLQSQTIETEQQGKAIQLLHYLCYGECAALNSDQSLWTLSKVLSGINPHNKVSLSTLTETDRNQCDDLLNAVIQHWTVLGSTSLAGLRETFLQRWGEMRYVEEKGWSLKVEQHALDVLLDRLPWRFSVIKYPFMEQVVHVDWR